MTTEKSGPTVNTTENPSSSSDTANQEFLVLTYVSVYSDNYGLALIILNIGHRFSFAKKKFIVNAVKCFGYSHQNYTRNQFCYLKLLSIAH